MIARRTIALTWIALSSIALAQEPTTPPEPQTATSNAVSAEPTPSAVNSPQTGTDTQVSAEVNPESTPLPPVAEASSADEVAAAQAAKLKELLSLVQDNTKGVHRRENPAYFMLVRQAMERTPEQLHSEVSLNPRFNDLYTKPSNYRGQLINVRLNARRILPVDYHNVKGVTRLYEIWGWTTEAKMWMYCCMVPELPAGFPEEGEISEEIELTGYFFKMQAYQPGVAESNARDLVAPLIIGRIVKAAPILVEARSTSVNWPLLLIIGFGSIVMFRLMMHMRGLGRTPPIRRNYRRRSLEPLDQEALEDALEVGPERGIRIRNANEA